MRDPLESLIVDMVEWVAARPRGYAETLDAWRTSCPRLPVWETAFDRGLLRRAALADGTPGVIVTPAGEAILEVPTERQRISADETM
jgi:hypothetical protein